MIGSLNDSLVILVFFVQYKIVPPVLDKTPEDTYTKVDIKLITPQKRRTAMIQNTITYYNLTDIYGEQVVLGVWRG